MKRNRARRPGQSRANRQTPKDLDVCTFQIPPQRTNLSFMGPPRRNPPQSTSISQMDSQPTFPRTPQRTPAQEQGPSDSPTASLGMSPASRYNYNLKVLRRRDPSIISIFDQFSHVCVYHHDGQQWSKHGYEGSMFLFER